MSWALAVLLAVVAFCVVAFVLRAPRRGWEAIGAALLLGIAGYGLQASPGLPGSPKPPAETVSGDAGSMVEARRLLQGEGAALGDDRVVIADALARHGQYANAAAMLRAAVEKNPHNAEAWLALANALVSHADGLLSPASLFAFRKAGEAEPDHPGPPFFLGLALAQSGRLGEARALWAELLERSASDAPWRPDLEARLARLDQFIPGQEAAPASR
jgi:cytochrome c-type biogenesis protein CcmH